MIGRSRSRRHHRLHRLAVLLLTVLLGVGSTAAFAPTAAWGADPTASMSIQKSADVSGVTPGQTFDYTIQVQCTAGTVNGCVNAQLVDPLPDFLELNGDILVSGTPTPPTIVNGPADSPSPSPTTWVTVRSAWRPATSSPSPSRSSSATTSRCPRAANRWSTPRASTPTTPTRSRTTPPSPPPSRRR